MKEIFIVDNSLAAITLFVQSLVKGQRHERSHGARFKFTNANSYFAAHGRRRRLKLDRATTPPLPPCNEKREINMPLRKARVDNNP